MNDNKIADTLSEHSEWIGSSGEPVGWCEGCDWDDRHSDESFVEHQAAMLAPLIEAREQEAAKVALREAAFDIGEGNGPINPRRTDEWLRARAGGDA